MPSNLIKLGGLTFKDTTGMPLAGYKLFIYEIGQSDLIPCYYDADGLKKIVQPIDLDIYGSALVYVNPDKSYRTVVKSPSGLATIGSSVATIGETIAMPSASAGSTSGGSALPSLTPFVSVVTFKSFPLVMAQKVITGPLIITKDVTGAVPGAAVLMRFVADGVAINTPVFTGFTQVTGSSGWDNRAGIVNLVQMQYDGTDYWFSIVQATVGAITDLQAPALLTSAISSTGGIVTLTYNEDLLSTSVPTPAMFSGGTVTSVAVSGKVVTLTLLPVIASGAVLNLGYTGNLIKDLAGNAAPVFTASMTVSSVSTTPVPVSLASRDTGFTEVVVGTYKTVSGGSWIGGVSTSLNFIGDATYETTDTSLAPSQGIIGLHPTATSIGALGSYPGIHVGIAYYGGNVNILQQGSQVNYGGWVAGTNMRIKRTGSTFVAQKKVAGGNWTTFHTYSYLLSAPMSTSMILNDNLNTMSAGVY